MRFTCRTKAWYSVRTPVNAFGGLSFGANDWSLGSGIGAKTGIAAGIVAILINLWLIPLVIPIAKFLHWL